MAYLESVAADFLKLEISKKAVIGAAIDGSDISEKALKTAAHLVKIRRGDELVICHVADNTKEYLPRNLQPANIKSIYLDKAHKLLRADASWACINKKPGQTTCEALVDLAHQRKVDMLVLGSFGRKGEKIDLLGSVSDFSLRQSHSSVCIVRATSSEWGAGASLLFLTDGSHAANIAFCALTEVFAKEGDTIMIAYVARDDEQAPDLTCYMDMLDKHQLKGSTMVKVLKRGTTVVEGILELSQQLQVDALVLGISGYGQKKLGSVSEAICLQAHCTTIIVKDILDPGSSKRLMQAGAASLQAQVSTRSTRASLEKVRTN